MKRMMAMSLVCLLLISSGCVMKDIADNLQAEYERNRDQARQERLLRDGVNKENNETSRHLEQPWKVEQNNEDSQRGEMTSDNGKETQQ